MTVPRAIVVVRAPGALGARARARTGVYMCRATRSGARARSPRSQGLTTTDVPDVLPRSPRPVACCGVLKSCPDGQG